MALLAAAKARAEAIRQEEEEGQQEEGENEEKGKAEVVRAAVATEHSVGQGGEDEQKQQGQEDEEHQVTEFDSLRGQVSTLLGSADVGVRGVPVEDALACPICFEPFEHPPSTKAPKALACLHTFCLSCLEKIAEQEGGSTITCPNQCTQHQLPAGGLAALREGVPALLRAHTKIPVYLNEIH